MHRLGKIFLDTVKNALDSGNYVSMLTNYSKLGGHYITIIGLNGRRIQYINPSNGDQVFEDDLSLFLKRGSKTRPGSVELSWLSKLEKPEEMVRQFGNQGLSYDDKKKTFKAEPTMQDVKFVGQTKGVLVSTGHSEDNTVICSTYIPKKAQ